MPRCPGGGCAAPCGGWAAVGSWDVSLRRCGCPERCPMSTRTGAAFDLAATAFGGRRGWTGARCGRARASRLRPGGRRPPRSAGTVPWVVAVGRVRGLWSHGAHSAGGRDGLRVQGLPSGAVFASGLARDRCRLGRGGRGGMAGECMDCPRVRSSCPAWLVTGVEPAGRVAWAGALGRRGGPCSVGCGPTVRTRLGDGDGLRVPGCPRARSSGPARLATGVEPVVVVWAAVGGVASAVGCGRVAGRQVKEVVRGGQEGRVPGNGCRRSEEEDL